MDDRFDELCAYVDGKQGIPEIVGWARDEIRRLREQATKKEAPVKTSAKEKTNGG